MRRVVAAYCLFFAGACAGPLPPLPALDEQVPSRVSILGIQPAGGGEILSPEALVVGGVYQLEGAVYSATNQALAGEPLVLSVETASFEELVRFPRGATCVTPTGTEMNAQRTCVIVFRLVGPVADIVLQLRAQRALNVIDEMPLVPLADRASASVRLIAPGIGSRVWQPGDSDPLVGVGPLPISMEDDEPTAFWVVLEDRFGNPLVGERVELRRWRSVQDLSDSPVSAGDAGADGSFDAGSAIDGQRPAFDAANSDLGLMDAAASDGPRADAAEGMDGGLRPAIDASSKPITLVSTCKAEVLILLDSKSPSEKIR